MSSLRSIFSLGIFINTALSTFHYPQEIHPGHGGPTPLRSLEPPFPNPDLDQPSHSLAPPQKDSDRQRPLNDRPPRKATAVIYPADSPALSSPEHENESHSSSLLSLCQDSPHSTIIFGTITSFSQSNGFPVADLSAAGCTRTRSSHDTLAPGLAACPDLGDEVRRCQELGKKVVLRIGKGGGGDVSSKGVVEGPTDASTSSLSTEAKNELNNGSGEYQESGFALRFKDAPGARRAALMLWKLFGQGDTHGPVGADSMQPLGDGVSVDGFDLGMFAVACSSGKLSHRVFESGCSHTHGPGSLDLRAGEHHLLRSSYSFRPCSQPCTFRPSDKTLH
ncbi:hypothetical protein IWZ03DRAFT_142794 [Phyllosticta citriasiana]|uniref:Uncharacterized protein n=1 Tax=Phyllosticta citriasiana TaxID=595635 RepID=A0ABR1KSW6_9PEZI